MNCSECGKEVPIGQWPWCKGDGQHGYPRGRQGGVVHAKERAVVYQHPLTGKTIYPPRNDVAMPAIYANAGFERKELTTLREVERLEKQDGVQSEVAWYDKGSGHADHMPEAKPIDMTGLEFKSVE